MSNTLNVVSQVRAGAKKLDWVKKLADELERVGSLEQAERETSDRIIKLKDREASVSQNLETRVKEAEKIENRAREFKYEAEDILSKANKSRQEIYKEAKKEAAEIVSEAKDFKSGADQTYAILIKEAEDRLKILVDKAKDAEHRVEASEAKLVDIESRIQNARDKAIKAYQEEFKNHIDR